MKTRSTVVIAALLAASTSAASYGDVVTSWNDALLEGIRTTRGWAPPQLARAGAIVHASVYDAVNSANPFANPLHTFTHTPGADSRAAAVEAGYQTMSSLFGNGVSNASFQATLDARRASDLASIPNGAAKSAGIALGASVASNTMNWRSSDGWNGSDAYTPGTNPGDWRPDYPGGTPGRGVGYQYRTATPWTMSSPSQFRPPAPPETTSAAYTASYNQVKELGSATSATRTADETKLAWFWGNDRDGTFKPPGHYNLLARTVADTQDATLGADGSEQRLQNNARLLALVNVAQADAGIAAWDAKYSSSYQAFWRPITGIRQGEFDNNPDTAGDAGWEPLSHASVGGGDYTPSFPAYISGHSTFGAATIEVLRQYFGTDNITFSLKTDDADLWALEGGDQNATWTYTNLTQASWDNAMSRIWLGVHWDFDATFGIEVGDNVGALVYQSTMQVPAPGAAVLLGGGLLIAGRRRRA